MINQDILNKLNYTKEWLKLGIINETILKKQLKSLETNPYPEHHRYDALKKYLDSKDNYTDSDIDSLIKLLSLDKELNATGLLYLLESNILTEDQFNIVGRSFQQLGDWANDKLFLLELTKNIQLKNLSLPEISLIIKQQNAKQQYVILENSLDKKDILNLLVKNSKFKKIVNRAKSAYSSAIE